MKNNRPPVMALCRSAAGLVLLGHLCSAQVPNRFEAGTVASASQVNENFEAARSSVEAVDSRVDDALSQIDAATAALAAQLALIEELEATVAERDAEITSLSNDVSALTSSVAALAEQFESLMLAESEDIDALAQVIPHLRMIDLDIGGGETRATVRFEGVNLQVVSGSGATNGKPEDPIPSIADEGVVDGLGNLIVGYNEIRDENNSFRRNGSHNLVVGFQNDYQSYGGVVFGRTNRVESPASSVTGGFVNTAAGLYSSISGGELGRTSSQSTSVSGGQSNQANGYASWAAGGQSNRAENFGSATSGGSGNTSDGVNSSVSGGKQREVVGTNDWRAGDLFQEE